jgi:hypothetical protein
MIWYMYDVGGVHSGYGELRHKPYDWNVDRVADILIQFVIHRWEHSDVIVFPSDRGALLRDLLAQHAKS